jgi:hypothetical protein
MRTLLTLIILSITLSAYPQRFKAGVLLGLNACQVDGDSYKGYNKAGLMAGLFANTPVNDKLTAQLEIKYMGKGAHKRATELDATEYTCKLKYIEIPLILNYKYKRGVEFESGLGFGILYSYSQEDESGELPKESMAAFKPFELSWLLGIGYRINESFTAKLRFSYSLAPIVDYPENPVQPYIARGAFNNLVTVGITYQL